MLLLKLFDLQAVLGFNSLKHLLTFSELLPMLLNLVMIGFDLLLVFKKLGLLQTQIQLQRVHLLLKCCLQREIILIVVKFNFHLLHALIKHA